MSTEIKQPAKYYNSRVRDSIYKYIDKNRSSINLKRNERYKKSKEANPEEVKRIIHERYLRFKARRLALNNAC